jgi:hypothetical protein
VKERYCCHFFITNEFQQLYEKETTPHTYNIISNHYQVGDSHCGVSIVSGSVSNLVDYTYNKKSHRYPDLNSSKHRIYYLLPITAKEVFSEAAKKFQHQDNLEDLFLKAGGRLGSLVKFNEKNSFEIRMKQRGYVLLLFEFLSRINIDRLKSNSFDAPKLSTEMAKKILEDFKASYHDLIDQGCPYEKDGYLKRPRSVERKVFLRGLSIAATQCFYSNPYIVRKRSRELFRQILAETARKEIVVLKDGLNVDLRNKFVIFNDDHGLGNI